MTSPDADLVRAARAGDRGAFEALHGRYRDWALTLARRFGIGREDAQDVVQEAFVYFFRKLPEFELRGSLKTFLYPVVKHLALSRREKSRRERTVSAAPEAASRDPGGRLEDLLAGLSEAQGEVVLLRFADGLDLEEIAQAVGVPVGTVKSRLHSALEILRKKFPDG